MIPWYGLLVLFPLFCALIGWVTNIIAVRMIFRPLVPRRFLGLRFQGVLPKHQERFARELGEVVTSDFMTTGEMVGLLDAKGLYQVVKPLVDQHIDAVLQELRALLPEAKRLLLSDAVVAAARGQMEKELLAQLPLLVDSVRQRADELVNLTDLIAEKLMAIGPARFVDLVSHLGRKELKFIEYYGGLFGFVIGLVQFTLINVFPIRLSLPVVGILVGAVTNYLAIKMLFFPRRPRRILLFTVQGLFPKRQEEIAMELARLAADEFIVTRKIMKMLAERVLPRSVSADLASEVEANLAARFPALKGMLDSILTPDDLEVLRRHLLQRYHTLGPAVVEAVVVAADRQLDMHAILHHKVSALSKLGFEEFIRGLFKEEELYLVIYGALLGGLMGVLQLGSLFLSRGI